MVGLVKALRATFPKALLLPNNAFQVLEHIASVVDGVARRYIRVAETRRLEKIALLAEIRRRHRLPVFTIEYAGSREEALRAYAYAAWRAASSRTSRPLTCKRSTPPCRRGDHRRAPRDARFGQSSHSADRRLAGRLR